MKLKVRPYIMSGNCWDWTVRDAARYSSCIIRDNAPVFRKRSLLDPGELHWLRALPDTMRDKGSTIPDRLLDGRYKYVMTAGTGGRGLIRRMDRLAPWLEKARGVIVQSREAYDIIKDRVPDQYIEIIPNGVDTEMFSPPPRPPRMSGTVTVGTAGMLTHGGRMDIKGYREYLDAARGSSRGYPRFTVSDNTRSHEDMPAYMRSLDIFVLASAWEGCSNAVLEAAACGAVPVITRTGYHGESMTDGLNAVLVDKDPDSILRAVEGLAGDHVKLSDMSRRAREYALGLDWSGVAPDMDRFFLKAYSGA